MSLVAFVLARASNQGAQRLAIRVWVEIQKLGQCLVLGKQSITPAFALVVLESGTGRFSVDSFECLADGLDVLAAHQATDELRLAAARAVTGKAPVVSHRRCEIGAQWDRGPLIFAELGEPGPQCLKAFGFAFPGGSAEFLGHDDADEMNFEAHL